MPIRILHLVDSLGKGGLENGMVNLLGRLDPMRFEHIVCAIRELGENAGRLPERVRVVRLGQQAAGARLQTPAMVRVIREFRPQVVHSRNWGAIEGVFAGRWAGSCAVIHGEHGLTVEAAAREPRRRIWMRRLAYELAHRVVAVSGQLRAHHAGRTGFAAERITVIHNGVDNRRFRPDPETRGRVRRELGLPDGEFCIGCVGNLFPVKDHMTLLRAIGEFAQESRAWRLLLIGEGPERPALEAFVKRAEWRGRVCFLGSSNRVAELLQTIDAYVLPSVFEGISNALLEAMASGIPAIATAVGGNPEVVIDGVSGLLFPAGDSRRLAGHLRALEARPEMRQRLGQHARRRVAEEFSIDSMAGKYADLYQAAGQARAVPERVAVGA
jgi:sugar transferase (PEP-CTERM/EpsH1 system associated)